jgi:hypothetical protein
VGWRRIGDSLKQKPRIFTSIEIEVFCDKLHSIKSAIVQVRNWGLDDYNLRQRKLIILLINQKRWHIKISIEILAKLIECKQQIYISSPHKRELISINHKAINHKENFKKKKSNKIKPNIGVIQVTYAPAYMILTILNF